MVKAEIDDQKYEILEARATEKGFDNAERYLDHLLSQIVDNIKNEKKSSEPGNSDDEELKQKLRDLGYM
jgi:hypothetical protein